MKITVTVKPGSKKGPLVVKETEDHEINEYTVFLREKAVDGAANAGLIKLLSSYFNVSKTNVTLIRGDKSRVKHLEINL